VYNCIEIDVTIDRKLFPVEFNYNGRMLEAIQYNVFRPRVTAGCGSILGSWEGVTETGGVDPSLIQVTSS